MSGLSIPSHGSLLLDPKAHSKGTHLNSFRNKELRPSSASTGGIPSFARQTAATQMKPSYRRARSLHKIETTQARNEIRAWKASVGQRKIAFAGQSLYRFVVDEKELESPQIGVILEDSRRATERAARGDCRNSPKGKGFLAQHRPHGILFAQSMVSMKKRRLQCDDGVDLDLSYVTSQVIAMGFPSTGLVGIYRNHIQDCVYFLESRHRGHYRVYNLCSERDYVGKEFAFRVERWAFNDHNPPSLEVLVGIVESMQLWCSQNPKNVAVIHCKAGKGRTGVVICAFLMATYGVTAVEAIHTYGVARTRDGQGVTLPSQQRFLHYYGRLLRSSGVGYGPLGTMKEWLLVTKGNSNFANDVDEAFENENDDSKTNLDDNDFNINSTFLKENQMSTLLSSSTSTSGSLNPTLNLSRMEQNDLRERKSQQNNRIFQANPWPHFWLRYTPKFELCKIQVVNAPTWLRKGENIKISIVGNYWGCNNHDAINKMTELVLRSDNAVEKVQDDGSVNVSFRIPKSAQPFIVEKEVKIKIRASRNKYVYMWFHTLFVDCDRVIHTNVRSIERQRHTSLLSSTSSMSDYVSSQLSGSSSSSSLSSNYIPSSPSNRSRSSSLSSSTSSKAKRMTAILFPKYEVDKAHKDKSNHYFDENFGIRVILSSIGAANEIENQRGEFISPWKAAASLVASSTFKSYSGKEFELSISEKKRRSVAALEFDSLNDATKEKVRSFSGDLVTVVKRVLRKTDSSKSNLTSASHENLFAMKKNIKNKQSTVVINRCRRESTSLRYVTRSSHSGKFKNLNFKTNVKGSMLVHQPCLVFGGRTESDGVSTACLQMLATPIPRDGEIPWLRMRLGDHVAGNGAWQLRVYKKTSVLNGKEKNIEFKLIDSREITIVTTSLLVQSVKVEPPVPVKAGMNIALFNPKGPLNLCYMAEVENTSVGMSLSVRKILSGHISSPHVKHSVIETEDMNVANRFNGKFCISEMTIQPAQSVSAQWRYIINKENRTQGWLQKKSRIGRRWQRRWFVLEEGVLSWFDNDRTSIPKRQINLTKEFCIKIRNNKETEKAKDDYFKSDEFEMTDESLISQLHKFEFKLEPPSSLSRTLHLRADDEGNLFAWVNAFEEQFKILDEVSESNNIVKKRDLKVHWDGKNDDFTPKSSFSDRLQNWFESMLWDQEGTDEEMNDDLHPKKIYSSTSSTIRSNSSTSGRKKRLRRYKTQGYVDDFPGESRDQVQIASERSCRRRSTVS
eukprot:g2610.t1